MALAALVAFVTCFLRFSSNATSITSKLASAWFAVVSGLGIVLGSVSDGLKFKVA